MIVRAGISYWPDATLEIDSSALTEDGAIETDTLCDGSIIELNTNDTDSWLVSGKMPCIDVGVDVSWDVRICSLPES